MTERVRFEEAEEEDEEIALPPLPPNTPNYLTPAGYARLTAEFDHLMKVERPQVVEVVSWAASNGDRSENGDYLYGKKRLREIDRRARFLLKYLDKAQVVDSEGRETDQVFFGATVVIQRASYSESETFSIVGTEEFDASQGRISWISPLARVLLKAREGDSVRLPTPKGIEIIEILEVRYARLD